MSPPCWQRNPHRHDTPTRHPCHHGQAQSPCCTGVAARPPNFGDLILQVSQAKGIAPYLVEKDYWLMHSLWCLQQQGWVFELKGGTSLSKGYGLIQRFSEDIDLCIPPPPSLQLKTGKNHDKPAHIAARLAFFDDLAHQMAQRTMPGIASIERDTVFDDYHDLYGLLASPDVQAFIGTPAYHARKQVRFPQADNQHIASNPAFTLPDASTRALYAGQVPFEAILDRIQQHIDRL